MLACWIRHTVFFFFLNTLLVKGLSENIGETMWERRKQEDVKCFYSTEVANRRSTVIAGFASENRLIVNTVM